MGLRESAAALAALALAGCTGAPGADFAEPSAYTYRVQYSAFAPNAGTWDITVADGRITAFSAVGEGTGRRSERFGVTTADLWTLGDIMDAYERAQRDRGAQAWITWDEAARYPAVVSIDWVPDAVDDEDYWTILWVAEAPAPAR